MLQEGDALSLEDGREVPIQSIKIVDYNYYIPVYNFEVEDYYTYYVSDINVLVHNMCAKKNKNSYSKFTALELLKNEKGKNKREFPSQWLNSTL